MHGEMKRGHHETRIDTRTFQKDCDLGYNSRRNRLETRENDTSVHVLALLPTRSPQIHDDTSISTSPGHPRFSEAVYQGRNGQESALVDIRGKRVVTLRSIRSMCITSEGSHRYRGPLRRNHPFASGDKTQVCRAFPWWEAIGATLELSNRLSPHANWQLADTRNHSRDAQYLRVAFRLAWNPTPGATLRHGPHFQCLRTPWRLGLDAVWNASHFRTLKTRCPRCELL
ncbi:hypothetical protein P152DRAFT_320683 [Eremomyces bilateralis CBS 781.70]|uniref:Uncharacterized protein n=1 Tax=Eremomyces bilateralis CBS 781.70 TaxID=1392243 RepID=A0A6G1G5X5_9PEZI|nr:uncharacterized protein P152DRAFT_320683 [Eremomyces bilateralis CBS 781.70]KAF1813467.1 hypothetical protein P152DRAFT_320683 [Eremomyces bilateralis CBS 781.70]